MRTVMRTDQMTEEGDEATVSQSEARGPQVTNERLGSIPGIELQ